MYYITYMHKALYVFEDNDYPRVQAVSVKIIDGPVNGDAIVKPLNS